MASNNPALMASNLSYNRSIAPSPALLTALNSASPQQAPKPVILQQMRGRGAFLNNYLGKDFDPTNPNIVEGDTANLPHDCDTFRIELSVNITAGSIVPNTCELPVLDQLLQDIATKYRAAGGYHVLASRYVWRLLNGSVMWRNYTVSADKKVVITFTNETGVQTVTANCRDLSKDRFPGITALRDAVSNVDVLLDAVALALSVEGDPLILNVVATGVVGYGGEVYPSQVFSETGDKTKKLVSLDLGNGQRQGKMNATKIGNAIRHIDEWHGSDEATAVEAYGFVQRSLSALRPANGDNFYNLLWQQSTSFPAILEGSTSANNIPGNIHYFVAMLIRGGVFAAPAGSSTAAQTKKAKKAVAANGATASTDDVVLTEDAE